MTKISVNVNSYKFTIDFPPICPHCHIGINPKIHYVSDVTVDDRFAILFSCPSCGNFIFYAYHFDRVNYCTSFIGYKTNPKININIPKEVKEISPRFVKIFTQSLLAREHNFDELVGIGLRKSIEFLIKDYLINFQNKDTDRISKMNLGSIFKELNDPKLNPLITAIVWIGNDETHYTRKYEDKTIADMIMFINALLHTISYEVTLKKAYHFVNGSIEG